MYHRLMGMRQARGQCSAGGMVPSVRRPFSACRLLHTPEAELGIHEKAAASVAPQSPPPALAWEASSGAYPPEVAHSYSALVWPSRRGKHA